MANLKRNFTQTFQSMDDTKKWVLQSGKRAEDVLYTFGMKCTTEYICHSFIIDPSDVSYIHHNVFSQAELEEIIDMSKKAFPDIPEQLRDCINSFNKNNTTDLRQSILIKQPWDEHYDSITHGDFDWVQNTVYNIVRLYESNDLQRPHLEQWYNMHIWRFFDTIYDGLEQIKVVQGEGSSKASAARKNLGRPLGSIDPLESKKCGHKCGLVLRSLSTEHDAPYEYGAGESDRSFGGVDCSKTLIESGIKLPKILKDIFDDIARHAGLNKGKLTRLETVSYITAGLPYFLLRYDAPTSYCGRITRSKVLHIPSSVTSFGNHVLPCLVLPWTIKEIISHILAMFDEPDDGISSNDSAWLQICLLPAPNLSPSIVVP
ncbi:hypothetical protein G6F56_000140 [Rhizopus delemar]|nr:hypothetical protein G6F56_000140 [Rhizopus delemar]